MIISKTPFRISFFGGGTDYPTWIQEHGGAVIGASINHYCYVNCRYLPPFFDHKYRVAYSKIEQTNKIDEVEHPVIRAALDHLEFHNYGVELHLSADLPARTGIGSSSACAVGVLNALIALRNGKLFNEELAQRAIHIEQKVLNETVGSQDQIFAAFGGFNRIDFRRDGSFIVTPVVASASRIQHLQDHFMLFFTGFSRFASEVARSQVDNMKNNIETLSHMRKMVDQALEIVENSSRNIVEFGELLHESWLCKRTLSEKVSTNQIDQIYQQAKNAGAIGGKLLGAGGGGFMLFFVLPEDQERVRKALSCLLQIPFSFEYEGSQLIFCKNSNQGSVRLEHLQGCP